MKTKFQIGDKVTVKESIKAYYSGYAGRPECWIEPGMVGVVASTQVPFVRGPRKYFNCVDFIVDGVYHNPKDPTSNVWRIGAQDSQLKKVN